MYLGIEVFNIIDQQKLLITNSSIDATKAEIKKKIGTYLKSLRDIYDMRVTFSLAPGGGKKILGGCATVAGWGNRYSTEDMHDNQAKCMTDYSNLSPDKIG